MTDHDAGDPKDEASDRRELERLAFARPETSADAAAAEDALRELVARDAAIESNSAPATPAPATAEVAQSESISEAESDAPGEVEREPIEPRPRTRPRSLVPLLVVAALIVGGAGGVLIGHATQAQPDPQPTASAGEISAFGLTPIGPQYASASSALAELATKQSADDVFPVPSFTRTLDIEPASIHRILTTDGLTLWTGRTSEDICLLFSGPDAISGADAGSNCATPTEFGTAGLTLSSGSHQWSWNGIQFTVQQGN